MANLSPHFECAPFSEMLKDGEISPDFRYGNGHESLPPAESWICASGVFLATSGAGLSTLYVNTPNFHEQPDDIAQAWLNFHAFGIEPRQKRHDDPRVDALISSCFGLIAGELTPEATLVGGALADNATGKLRFGMFHRSLFSKLGPSVAAGVNGVVPPSSIQAFSPLESAAMSLIPENPPGESRTRMEFAQQVASHSLIIRMFSRSQLLEDLGRQEEPEVSSLQETAQIFELPTARYQERTPVTMTAAS